MSSRARKPRPDKPLPSSPVPRSSRRAGLILVCLLPLAAALIAHWPALRAQAIAFDDNEYLLYNPLVQNPSWGAAGQFLTEVLEPSTVHGYYQPLTMISLMLDTAMGGRPDHLRPYHRTSLILHAANAVLIALLLWLLFENPWAATTVAVLFAVHPITVEPIPWVSERKTLLAAFFALLSLIAYVRYGRRGGWWRMGLCVAAYLLSLMAKPTGTMLPLAMLLMDFWPLRRLNPWVILEKTPLFLVTILSAWITYESQKRTAVVVNPEEIGDIRRIPLTICHNIIFYLRLFIWPAGLSSHYPLIVPISSDHPRVLAGVIGTCLLIPALVISLLKTRALLTGWLIFFVLIFPTLGIIGFTNVIASDKYAYLPAVGLLMLLTCGLDWAWTRLRTSDAPAIRRATLPLAVVALGSLAVTETTLTRRYLAEWSNTERLFRHMVRLAPDAGTLHFHLGFELARQNRTDEAIAEYRRVTELLPHYDEAFNNLGVQLMKKNQVEEAIGCYRHTLELEPQHPRAGHNLANALARLGRTEEALTQYRHVLDLHPEMALARWSLADLLIQNGRMEEALSVLADGAQSDPLFWSTISDKAWALASDPQRLNPPVAVRLAELACQLTGYRQPATIGALAAAHEAAGQTEQARLWAGKAIGLAQEMGQKELAAELLRRLSGQGRSGLSPSPANADNR